MDAAAIGARALAERAHAQVQQDPRRASTMAREALEQARAEGDRPAEVAALHALGFAQNALADPAMTATLRRAVRVARAEGLGVAESRARLALAGALVQTGSVRAALREVERAAAGPDAFERARTEVFRLGVLFHSGRPYGERARSTAALRLFRSRDEPIWEARLLFNRGLVLGERGEVGRALADLRAARELYASIGAEIAAVDADLAIAEMLVLLDEVPAALRALDGITGDLPTSTRVDLELARSRALVTAMLVDEALRAVDRAIGGMRGHGRTDRALRAEVTRARLLLLAGDADDARRAARAAARAFARRGQAAAAARARVLALAASTRLGQVRPDDLVSGALAATVLHDAGHRRDAQQAHLTVAAAAVVRGSLDVARAHLALARRGRRGAVLADRLLEARVDAQVKLAEGESAAAARVAAGGLDRLDRYRLTLGSIELRARASGLGQELAILGLRLALEDGDGRRLLTWAERLRASALLGRPSRSHDPAIVAAQTELRRLERLDDGRDEGRRAALEREIERRARHHAATAGTEARRPSVPALCRELGDRTLVELVSIDGELHAVCARRGVVRHRSLGIVGEPRERLEWLRFGLRQLARADLSRARRAAAAVGVTRDLELLDAELVEPLLDWTAGAELVLAPGAELAAAPWAMLPSLAGRTITIAPSASLWHRLGPPAGRGSGRIVLVAGPELAHARREINGLSALHPRATVLTGVTATVEATLEALDGARIAHLATHGHFRADSPLFSAFRLADGLLSAHELAGLERPPELIVLSACELALSDARPGDELLGLAATLLGLGTRAIVASVAPIPDREAPRLMRSLHAALLAGNGPAAALAVAQARHRKDVGAGTFVCLGRS